VSGVVDVLTTRRPARREPWDAGPEATERDLAALHRALSAQLASVVRELGGRPEVRVELLPDLADLTPPGGVA
jgi:hypothetical protein